MQKVKNVVIVNDFDYINGGAAKVAIETAKIFENNANVSIYFFSAVSKNISNSNNKQITFITTNQNECLKDKNILRGSLNGLWNFKAKREFEKMLMKFNPEDTIIHIHGWMKALSSSPFYIANKMKFKVIVTFHDYFSCCPNGGLYNYKKNEICKAIPMSKKCLRCNCDSRNYLFKMYRVIRQFIQNSIVKMNKNIKYVVSISDFSYQHIKNNLNKNVCVRKIYNPIICNKNEKIKHIEDNENFLYVGRITKEKGVELFCRAVTELKCRGIVVGDGNQRKMLESKYPNIEFVGWKEEKQIKQYMLDAKTLIFPSLWYECAPLTPLEAMSVRFAMYNFRQMCSKRIY